MIKNADLPCLSIKHGGKKGNMKGCNQSTIWIKQSVWWSNANHDMIWIYIYIMGLNKHEQNDGVRNGDCPYILS